MGPTKEFPGATKASVSLRSLLVAEADASCAEKEAAIEAHEFERAANNRDRERKLRAEARGQVERHQEELLAEVRARLGLGDQK